MLDMRRNMKINTSTQLQRIENAISRSERKRFDNSKELIIKICILYNKKRS